MKVIFYRNKCIGCSSCSDIFPEKWQVNELDGKMDLAGSVEKKNGIHILDESEIYRENHVLASESCPVNSIEIK